MSVDQENDPITMDWLTAIVRGLQACSNKLVASVRAEDFDVLVHRQPNGAFAVTLTSHDGGGHVNGSIRTRTQFIRMASVVGLPLRGICTS